MSPFTDTSDNTFVEQEATWSNVKVKHFINILLYYEGHWVKDQGQMLYRLTVIYFVMTFIKPSCSDQTRSHWTKGQGHRVKGHIEVKFHTFLLINIDGLTMVYDPFFLLVLTWLDFQK